MASNLIKNVSEANFDAEVLKSPVPVLVDFWAEWCGPCKMIAPVLDEVATELDGQVKIAKVDVDAETALASQYGITAIPTLLVFKGGQIVDQMRGAKGKRAIRETLEPYLNTGG
jgi:thioredoxin 1